MNGYRPRSVAILGGGPAGACLGTLLAREGLEVAIFARTKRPPVIIGESLVPAIVPYLRTLAIEQEVSEFSIWKGGATFVFNARDRMSFRFHEVRDATTTYSYNVPRDLFDAAVLRAAKHAGVRVIEGSGRVERVGETDRLRLADDSLALLDGELRSEPEFIVDAAQEIIDKVTPEGQGGVAGARVAKAKEQAQHRRWVASRLHSKRWGDRVEHDVSDQTANTIADLVKRASE